MEIRDTKGRFRRKYIDISGERFFRLVAIRKVDMPNDKNHSYWECKCDCGNTVIVRRDSLKNGHAKSCGCYLQERYKDGHLKTHGEKCMKLYKAWQSIKQRCKNPKSESYNNYGGRGITICDEWENDYLAFKKWSMANGFDPNAKGHELSIDRINVDGNYEPNNCRWVGHVVQNYNKRCTVKVDIYGKLMTLKDISDEYDIPISRVRKRYYRYKKGAISIEDLLNKGCFK